MATRKDRGFRFPLDKYHDKIALHTNFKYLQEYLNYIRRKDIYGTQFIIATNTSSNDAKHRAHYVTDGSNDNVQLQAAFDDLPTAGGEVVLLDGTYTLASDITLPAGRVRLTGKGAKISCASGVGFIASSHTMLLVDGVEFTRTGSSDTDLFVALSSGGQSVFANCYFHDMGANGIIGSSSSGGSLLVTGCRFDTITLNENFEVGLIRYNNSAGDGQHNQLIFTGNYVANLTDNSGFRAVGIMYEEGGGNTGIVTGNVFANIDSIPLATGGSSHASHNIVDETMVAGDHDDLDHGSLDGLTDDDHTQYLNDTRHNNAHGALRAERITSDQTIVLSATLIYNSVVDEDDPDGDISFNTSTGVATINNAGWYLMNAGAFMSSPSTDTLFNMRLLVNGSANPASKRFQSGLNGAARVDTFSTTLKLAATDTVEIQMGHNDSSSVDFLATPSSFFTITKLREA